MDIEKTMILVKDEDKTETVVAVSFDIASRKTQVTYTGGHSYFYNSANVLVLENPKSIDLNGRVALSLIHILYRCWKSKNAIRT